MPSFKSFAVKTFGSVASKNEKSFEFIRLQLQRADIKEPLSAYLSIMFLATIISLAAAVTAAVLLSLLVISDLMTKVLVLFMIPVLVPAVVFAVLMIYPSYKANERKKSIETNLPFVLTHMGSIAESGIPPYVIYRLIGNFDEYGEIAKEFRKIARNIDVYGIDPLTSVRSVAEKSPSEMFKQVLLGFVTTTESGGNIKMYLKSSGEQALFEWRARREKFLEQLSAYAEMYTGLMVAAPLFIISLFVVMGMISPSLAGFNILDLTRLSIYFLVPAMNIGFLMFLRSVEVEI